MVDEAQRQRTTFPDAREQFIADQGYQRTVVDPIVRRQHDLVESYEGTGITPQTFPDWVTENPNAFEMMNEWSMPGGRSWMGSPMWMDAGITNPNLNGYKVWKAGSVQDKIDSWLGPFIDKHVDLENWEPTPWDFGIGNWIKNKINPKARLEKAKEENELLNKELDELRMSPANPEPGPWNEFYPGDVEHINDFLFEDEGIEPYEWDESAGTQLAGTIEDKWGQLVRDGIINPGDTLNPLQIDQLYNQYYEGGAGDLDQFGVAQSRWKEMWDVMIQNLIDRGIVLDEKEGNTYMFEKTGQSKPMPITSNRGGIIGLI
jgi:hypothetical protein